MKNLSKKILAVLVVLTISFTVFTVAPATASAATSKNNFDYKCVNGETIEITGYCGNDANVTIPSTIAGKKVTSIGEAAFAGCTSVKSVSIPSSVKSIGKWVFRGCTSLKSIRIPGNVKSVGSCAFLGCANLESVTMDYGVTSIGDFAFVECSKLKNVIISKSVKSIGIYAFWVCESITNVTVPNSHTAIAKNYFFDSEKLNCIKDDGINVTMKGNFVKVKPGVRKLDGAEKLAALPKTINAKNVVSVYKLTFYSKKSSGVNADGQVKITIPVQRTAGQKIKVARIDNATKKVTYMSLTNSNGCVTFSTNKSSCYAIIKE